MKLVPPHILETTDANGNTLYWGGCSHCGFVVEISRQQCENWQRTGVCEICTEEVAAQERAQEKTWWRAMSSR